MAITKLSDSSITTGDKYISMLAGNSAFIPSIYDSISTVTVDSGGSSSISFTSIPSTYTHLQIRGVVRTNRTAFFLDYAKLNFNSDSGTNYTTHHLYGDGTTAYPYAESDIAFTTISRFASSTATANTFGTFITDILDYSNTNKFKTLRNLGGCDTSGAGEIGYYSGLWRSAAAISSITIVPGGGTSFNQYSQFALYGIRGS